MAITLTVNGIDYEFPTSGADPDWAGQVVEWAQAITDQVNGALNGTDIPPTTFSVPATGTVSITGLLLDSSSIRGAIVEYTIARSTTLEEADEIGKVEVLYRNDTADWEIYQERNGDAKVSLSISPAGQFSMTVTAMSGSDHSGLMVFRTRGFQQ